MKHDSPTERPYFTWPIIQLEALFDRSREDPSVLRSILHELDHRGSDRSSRLRDRVSTTQAQLPDRLSEHHDVGETGTPLHPVAEDIEYKSEASSQPSQAIVASKASPREKPDRIITDEPQSILSAWTALEVLSPQTYRKPSDLTDGEERRIARLNSPLPWSGTGEGSRPNRKLFYQVILGAIRMEEATTALLKIFADKNQDRQPARGFAAIAAITIDKSGRPVQDSAVAISSFAWGLPLALNGDLRSLDRWPQVEPRLIEAVDEQIRKQDENGQPRPLTISDIERAYKWLTAKLGLNGALIDPPTFALRVYHYFRAQEPPDPPLLGSFFLGDLAAAKELVSTGKAPRNIRRYLRIEKPETRKDILRDPRWIAAAVSPNRIPAGRWPSKDRKPLVLLQQAAVNLAMSDLPGAELIAVNGPPGTGKTTLLRDIVAALVVRRAEAMCQFDNPENAFTISGETQRVANATIRLSRVDSRLRGFEMLVASSNNKAVENVSAELPGLNAIASDAPDLRYFKTVSDGIVKGESQTWGLVAAVLGNAKNRFAFREAAWANEDSGLQTYLAAAAGNPQWLTEDDPDHPGATRKRKPMVVERESPPKSRDEALRRWKQAKRDFSHALGEVKSLLAEIESARKEAAQLPGLREAAEKTRKNVSAARVKLDSCQEELSQLVEVERAATSTREAAAMSFSNHRAGKPAFFSRLFRTDKFRAWADVYRNVSAQLDSANKNHEDAANKAAASKQRLQEASRNHALSTTDHAKAAASRDAAEERVARMRARYDARVIDGAFFDRSHTAFHLDAPWLDDVAHGLRDRVFEFAIALHKAFVDAAAIPLQHNITALIRAFFGKSAWSPKLRPIMPDLWASLFLIVPVVSTTFASVERMLGYLPPEALGWLLVDEAGQALPQAVIGAMMRTRRAIIVGDPLQIEPVTSLPSELAETICEEFGVEPAKWSAPAASVQTVADATVSLGAEFQRKAGSIQVGWPLLVHRRCAEPMFSLSNSIAYSDLMVHASPPRDSSIRDVLGPSKWFDVAGEYTQDKWSEAEGEVVLTLFKRLAYANLPDLDIYVITPFLIVSQRLRERLKNSGAIAPWTEEPWQWVQERVGTIHTVQGREADSVILVLGAPMPAQRGARGWAGGTPNILNVAATRAKENLYVVGSHSAWRDAGCFSELARRLPVSTDFA
jgi:hypothetical protein